MKHTGFTLAELLIALALLGIIAAFTIPKVLQSSAENERVAKLRETVASLEDAWYGAKGTNQIVIGPNGIYDTLAPKLNTIKASQFAPGDPLEIFATIGHPCNVLGGYVVLHNGVVIMGLVGPGYLGNDLLTPTQVDNTAICIDTNGVGEPNIEGQDVFYGSFNPWGDFDVAQGAVYTVSQTSKNFFWGNATEDVYDIDGSAGGVTQTARVGYWLTR